MNYRVVISVFLAAILLGPVARAAAQDKSAVPGNFVLVPRGAFTIGSPEGEAGRTLDEGQRDVTISKSFLMGQHEVTVGAFRQFVETTGYTLAGGGFVWTGGDWQEKDDAQWDNPYFSQADDQPVVLVSWYDAIAYSNWLSEREGLAPAYTVDGNSITWNRDADGYRLPTEAEWEYAARAGVTTAYLTGDTAGQANYNGGTKTTYLGRTTAVGSFPANTWGLYDMAGNAREWCWDGYGSYPRSVLTDPAGYNPSPYKVHRGGSWVDFAQTLRFARRLLAPPETRISAIGFRLVKAVPEGYVPTQGALNVIVESYELTVIDQFQAAFETWFNEGDDIDQLHAEFNAIVDQFRNNLDTIVEKYEGTGIQDVLRTELGFFTDELQAETDAFMEYLAYLDTQIQPIFEELLAEEPTVDQFKNELNALIDQLKDELDIAINDYEDGAIRNKLKAAVETIISQLKEEVNLIVVMYGEFETWFQDFETELNEERENYESGPDKEWLTDIVPEQSLDLYFGSAGEVQYIRLSINHEGEYQISAKGITIVLDTYLELYTADETFLGRNDDGGGNFDALLKTYLSPGDYFIAVECFTTSPEDGSYRLSVTELTDEDIVWSAEIAPSEPVELAFIDSNDINYVRLNIDHEGWYRITAKNQNGINLDTYLELYDSGKNFIDYGDDSGNSKAALLEVFLTPDAYIIVLECIDLNPIRDGSYTLTVDEIVTETTDYAAEGDVSPVLVTIGKPVELRFALNQTQDAFFTIDHEGWYQITAKNGNGVDLDTFIELYDINGNFLGYADDNMGEEFFSYADLITSLEPGDYHLIIDCFDNYPLKDNSYVLSITELVSDIAGIKDSYENDDTPDNAKEIAVGESQNRTFTNEYDIDYVILNIVIPGRYLIRARNVNGVDIDTGLIIYDAADTNNYAFDDDSGDGLDALLDIELGAGKYFLVIGCSEEIVDLEDNSYVLSIEQF